MRKYEHVLSNWKEKYSRLYKEERNMTASLKGLRLNHQKYISSSVSRHLYQVHFSVHAGAIVVVGEGTMEKGSAFGRNQPYGGMLNSVKHVGLYGSVVVHVL